MRENIITIKDLPFTEDQIRQFNICYQNIDKPVNIELKLKDKTLNFKTTLKNTILKIDGNKLLIPNSDFDILLENNEDNVKSITLYSLSDESFIDSVKDEKYLISFTDSLGVREFYKALDVLDSQGFLFDIYMKSKEPDLDFILREASKCNRFYLKEIDEKKLEFLYIAIKIPKQYDVKNIIDKIIDVPDTRFKKIILLINALIDKIINVDPNHFSLQTVDYFFFDLDYLCIEIEKIKNDKEKKELYCRINDVKRLIFSTYNKEKEEDTNDDKSELIKYLTESVKELLIVKEDLEEELKKIK